MSHRFIEGCNIAMARSNKRLTVRNSYLGRARGHFDFAQSRSPNKTVISKPMVILCYVEGWRLQFLYDDLTQYQLEKVKF